MSSADESPSAAMASAKRSLVEPAVVAWARLAAKSLADPVAPSVADGAVAPGWATPGDCCNSAMVCSMSANETWLMVMTG